MLTIKYFARIRDLAGESERQMDWRAGLTAADVLTSLRGESFRLAEAFSGPVLVAINHEMVGLDSPLNDGDEVAFFPPVTGG
ncbi:MAG: MoaD/ThiS family protein [Hahellaceae bacterium]|jgi:molybdopterin synthase sulfur carrier subunit|nr:MoaD/ThiS family protein [Hahellaceae bacterium]